jgi:mono/diheme cytochrome c family protein
MIRFVLLSLIIFTTAACTPQEEESSRTDILRGKQLYQENCAACHGVNADGAGAASLGLGVAPPSLRDLSAGNGGIYPRDYVLGTIDGLARHNDPTAAMPEFGAGDMGTVVLLEENGLTMPIPANLLAIANYLETLQN